MQGMEACAGSRVFVASRVAALAMYGADGLKDIATRLPEAARVVADNALITEKWLPEDWIMAWHDAVWHGPARTDDDAFRNYVRRVVDAGFGRVRRLLVNLVTPATLCNRAAELWHDEHTHGEITAHPEGNVVTIRLRAHPYVMKPVSRLVMAESLRHAASLTRAKDVNELHHLDGDTLEVKLTWR